jgi:branched-subunit amino acid transport protein AzlD
MSGALNFLVGIVLTDVFIQKGRVGIPFKQWMRTVCTLHKPPHPHPSSSLLTYISVVQTFLWAKFFFLSVLVRFGRH